MSDNEPTEEQLQEFWEWCGFRQLPRGNKAYHFERGTKVMNWLPPGETETWKSVDYLPYLDLNNLFQYAILKLKRIGYSYELVEWNEGQHKAIINKLCKGWAETYTTSVDKNPALALFWAIWEVVQLTSSRP